METEQKKFKVYKNIRKPSKVFGMNLPLCYLFLGILLMLFLSLIFSLANTLALNTIKGIIAVLLYLFFVLLSSKKIRIFILTAERIPNEFNLDTRDFPL